jgi:hypothetical protein
MPQPLERHWWIRTLNPSADTYLSQGGADTNYGTSADLKVGKYTNWNCNSVLTFNLASLPTPFIVIVARLSLYTTYADGAGILAISRLLRTDWVESQATWNSYKTGSNWGTAGALNASTDYTATDQVSTAGLAATNWVHFDPRSQVQYALDSVAGIAHFLLRDISAVTTVDYVYNSSAAATNKPELIVCGYQP